MLLGGKLWRWIETPSVERRPNGDASKSKVRVDGECRCRVTAVALALIIASYRQRQGNGFRCPSQCRSGKIIASDIACRAIVQAHKPAIAVMFVIAADQTEGQFIRSEEHTSELQSLMRISYAVFCLKKKTKVTHNKLVHISILLITTPRTNIKVYL